MQSRRDWFKSSIGIGGLMLTPSILTAEEIKKYNPRSKSSIVKLSSNENPYGPSERVLNAIKNSFNDACRYPYEFIQELQKTLAKKHDVPIESIVITGGSNEALRITGLAISNKGGNIVAGQPTYLALMNYAEAWGAEIKWVPVDSDKGYDLKKIRESIDKETNMVFIANPNNPTGTLLNANSLANFCEDISKQTLVFCDEAYYDYINEKDYPSMDYLVRKGENVIISRTFSKVYGMAGLRIGYLVLKPKLADDLFGKYSPYGRPNIMAQTNVLAVAAASEALKDTDFYKFSLKKANEEKDKIYKLLDYLDLKYVKSSTNFVFFESKKHIDKLSAEMLEKGVRVGRPFPPFYDWCRISTGTSEEVDIFIESMLEVYS
ncbi:aminotransferase class I/II-fold pyridoxal phosphate-dependent enzyme [Flavobacteriaceae bacterium]|nr:aminotransferase class I/II-fold pyridoxal phosphate-dependent enzyme [Flavobacteriaceae bacterium]